MAHPSAGARQHIPAEQVRFRRCRSVEENLGRLIQEVQDGWKRPRPRGHRSDGKTSAVDSVRLLTCQRQGPSDPTSQDTPLPPALPGHVDPPSPLPARPPYMHRSHRQAKAKSPVPIRTASGICSGPDPVNAVVGRLGEGADGGSQHLRLYVSRWHGCTVLRRHVSGGKKTAQLAADIVARWAHAWMMRLAGSKTQALALSQLYEAACSRLPHLRG